MEKDYRLETGSIKDVWYGEPRPPRSSHARNKMDTIRSGQAFQGRTFARLWALHCLVYTTSAWLLKLEIQSGKVRDMNRRTWFTACCGILLTGFAHRLPAQTEPDGNTHLANGSLEESVASGELVGWFVPVAVKNAGYEVRLDATNPFAGETSALLDATQIQAADGLFGNLMQTIDAKEFRGRRIRFRAAVRTAELRDDGRAQLWLRVDCKTAGGQQSEGAFDNMGDRPIRDTGWQHYEIVAQVDDNATSINVGMLLLGRGRAWLDDASLEIVSGDTPQTGFQSSGQARSNPQPFFVSWLWLVAITLVLFVLSHAAGPATATKTAHGPESPETNADSDALNAGASWMGLLHRFAFRFSFVYWLLYSLPVPFSNVFPFLRSVVYAPYQQCVDAMVMATAANGLGIDGMTIAFNGSGDKTSDYVWLLDCFVLSLVIAVAWSLVDRRRRDHLWLRDLLRSYLRYVLAFTMLGYGIAKLGVEANQFPVPDVDQLTKTYGESSPMNLVWTFMGASRSYTLFAGLGEIAAALLLVWRRTTTLGAVVALGVLLNIVMLNFCYDVPVKQYSCHLLVMALYLLLPDARRLSNLFIWNRHAEKVEVQPPYARVIPVWIPWIVKAFLIVVGLAIPLVTTIYREAATPSDTVQAPALFGAYAVEEFVRDGQSVPPLLTDTTRWRYLSLRRLPWSQAGRPGQMDFVQIRMMDDSRVSGTAVASDDNESITLQTNNSSVPSELTMDVIDQDFLTMSGNTQGQSLTVRLRRLDRGDFLLMNRGFRWINEYPFNR